MKDKRGFTVMVGDEIAYAQRDGNSSCLRLYRIIAVDDAFVKAEPIDSETSRTVTLRSLTTHGVVVGKAGT